MCDLSEVGSILGGVHPQVKTCGYANATSPRSVGQKNNVFDKPNEQNEARFNSAMARKGRIKFNYFLMKMAKYLETAFSRRNFAAT